MGSYAEEVDYARTEELKLLGVGVEEEEEDVHVTSASGGRLKEEPHKMQTRPSPHQHLSYILSPSIRPHRNRSYLSQHQQRLSERTLNKSSTSGGGPVDGSSSGVGTRQSSIRVANKSKNSTSANNDEEVKNEDSNSNQDNSSDFLQPPSLSLSLDPTDPEFVIRFIRRVESTPVLYSPDDENFRNVVMKQAEWNKISREFGQNSNWCMKKWVSLRDYFVKRKKLIKSGGKPGRAWIYYNEMKFLNCIYGEDEVPSSMTKMDGGKAESSYTLSEEANNYYDTSHMSSYDGNDMDNNEYEDDYSNEPEVEVELEEHDDQELNVKYDDDDGQGHGHMPMSYHFSTSDSPNPSISNLVRMYSSASSRSSIKRRREDEESSNIQNYNGAHNLSNNSSSSNQNHQEYEQEEVETVRVNGSVNLNHEDDDVQVLESNNMPFASGGAVEVDSGHSRFKQHDAYDLFCLSVAARMRNMPRDKAFRLQMKIMEMMYESEFLRQ